MSPLEFIRLRYMRVAPIDLGQNIGTALTAAEAEEAYMEMTICGGACSSV